MPKAWMFYFTTYQQHHQLESNSCHRAKINRINFARGRSRGPIVLYCAFHVTTRPPVESLSENKSHTRSRMVIGCGVNGQCNG